MKKGLIVFMLLVFMGSFWSFDLKAGEKGAKIIIDPARAVYGTPFSLKIEGLSPGEVVSLKASSTDARGVNWESRLNSGRIKAV